MFRIWTAFAVLMMVSCPGFAQITGDMIEYKDGDITLQGYMSYDKKAQGKAPGVLVIHDWMGLSAFYKEIADKLAKMGYVGFAVDVYGKGVRPNNNKEAAELAKKYKSDRELMRKRINAGLDKLKTYDNVDKGKLAAIGFCFGGTVALELARSGADIEGVVTFHGGLDSPEPEAGENIKASILVLHGADDPYVMETDIRAFKEEMKKADVDWQMIYYGNAVHSFT
ncbi:dienelactone hydrolase family protein, partial [Candidatus Micrarchaeota archaeon]|nr:dienelactone hydrolase family protein [Candidatus Micrarchaeota archaeon]